MASTGFKSFADAFRPSVRDEFPDFTLAQVSKELTRRWKSLSAQEQQKWVKKQESELELELDFDDSFEDLAPAAPTAAKTAKTPTKTKKRARSENVENAMEFEIPSLADIGVQDEPEPTKTEEPTKKRKKTLKFDAEVLMSEQGFPLLIQELKKEQWPAFATPKDDRNQEAPTVRHFLNKCREWAFVMFPSLCFEDLLPRIAKVANRNEMRDRLLDLRYPEGERPETRQERKRREKEERRRAKEEALRDVDAATVNMTEAGEVAHDDSDLSEGDLDFLDDVSDSVV
ncbi:MAG: hypothetical protein MHM6MM_007386 [Cercozoa sp. M6MM]